MKKKFFFIASGGTGGHIIPARCLASQLVKENQSVRFFGDEKYRSYIKPSDEFSSKIIFSSKLEKSPLKLLKAALKIFAGTAQSLFFFLKDRPKCVIAFGGYATFPVLLAALITKTEIILHEQNSHLGKVNRVFAKYAKKIATSFAQTSGISDEFLSKISFVGNPVREEILRLHRTSYKLPEQQIEAPKPDNRMGYDVILASEFHRLNEEEVTQDYFRILVIGGSGGAKIFSEILPKAFFNLSERLKEKIFITQQCRRELVSSTFDQYRNFNINITIDSFFEDMPELIAASHLVIGRCGSSSIFEFCAARKPMILIPFAAAADDHQEKNARYLEQQGAAVVVRENEFTINRATDLLKNLIDSEATLKKMSDNAANLAVLDATKNLASLARSN